MMVRFARFRFLFQRRDMRLCVFGIRHCGEISWPRTSIPLEYAVAIIRINSGVSLKRVASSHLPFHVRRPALLRYDTMVVRDLGLYPVDWIFWLITRHCSLRNSSKLLFRSSLIIPHARD